MVSKYPDLKGLTRVEDAEHAKLGGGVVPRYFEQPEEVEEIVITEDENGQQIIESPKPKAEEPTKSKKSRGRPKKTSSPEVQVVEKEVVVEIEKPLSNNFRLTADSPIGTLVSEIYDISFKDNLLVISYLPTYKGNKFLPKDSSLSVDIVIEPLADESEPEEYTVKATGITFTLETSGLLCTLLEVV